MKCIKKNLIIFCCIFTSFLFQYASAEEEIQAGVIYQIKEYSGEVTISSPVAGETLKMGDALYIKIGTAKVILKVTFPMQTVARCTVLPHHRGFMAQLAAGMPVFKYQTGADLQTIKSDFERLDEITLYSRKIIYGAIIERGKTYIIMTPAGRVEVKEKDIMKVQVIK